MSLTLVGSPTKAGSASNLASITVTTNSSTAVGDLILITIEGKASTNTRAVAPDGTWTDYGKFANSIGGAMTVLSKVATSAGAQSFTFTFKGTGADTEAVTNAIANGVCYIVRGQHATTPVSALTAGGSGTSQAVTFPTVTTTADAELVFRFLGGQVATGTTDEKTPTWDAAVGNTVTAQGNAGTGTGTAFITGSVETGPTPGAAIGTRSLTLQNTPSTWSRISVGVVPAASGTPANTVAPAVTGTAAVGQVLTTTTGTWDQSGLTYTYQWQRDGSDISGATGSTYTVVSGDAGHTIRCVVTATHTTNGSGTANSNGVAIPAAPVNTVAPAISPAGPYNTGDVVTVSTGTWTGSGISYTYQWYRGASPISGEVTNTYTLAVTDEGANISARVTATNGGAPSGVTANSNTIVPNVATPLSDASFLNYLSGGTGNTDPALSIGGARGGTYAGGLNDLLGPIIGSVAQAGGTFYRVVYVRNTHTTATLASAKLFIEQQFSHVGLELAVAVPAEAANVTVPALASGTTAPSGVTWTTATTAGAGLDFGSLAPLAYRGIYVRVTVAPGTALTAEADAIWAVSGSSA
jgi:hypothetical protein